MNAERDAELREWYLAELRRLGFSTRQRREILERVEAGEIEFRPFCDLIEKRGWSTLQAFLWAA